MSEDFLQKLSIGELAKASGVTPSAIRYYESRGLLRSSRTEGGQRRYGGEAPLALRQLSFAKSAGFTLAEVGALLGPMQTGEPLFDSWRGLAEKKLVELDAVIDQAQDMKRRLAQALACSCERVEDCALLNDATCT